jgi:cytochrome c oxidase assembly protein subunit 15
MRRGNACPVLGKSRLVNADLVLAHGPWQTLRVQPSERTAEGSALSRFWTAGLIYTLFVILFGAVVRITGSGAGCGQNWPSCHGELVHLPKKLETAIELAHRVTSGVSMVVVFVLAYLTFRRFGRKHPARRAAAYSCLFMIVEALVGAALVLLELVGENDSVARAAIMAVHLVNTMALMAAIVISLWIVRRPRQTALKFQVGSDRAWAYGGAAVLAVVSAAGAVTALGDTLYPVAELAQAVPHSDASDNFLTLLRGVHPIMAVVGAAVLVWGAGRLTDAEAKNDDREAPIGPRTKMARGIVALVVIQVFLGLLNIVLSAPGWMQVVHLACANLIWIAWLWGWLHVASGVMDENG